MFIFYQYKGFGPYLSGDPKNSIPLLAVSGGTYFWIPNEKFWINTFKDFIVRKKIVIVPRTKMPGHVLPRHIFPGQVGLHQTQLTSSPPFILDLL